MLGKSLAASERAGVVTWCLLDCLRFVVVQTCRGFRVAATPAHPVLLACKPR